MEIIWIILAVIAAAYGVVVKTAGSGTMFFGFWILLGVLFAALSICAKLSVWSLLPKLAKLVIRAGLMLLAAAFVCIEVLVAGAFMKKSEPGLDYIIVLGAQLYENGPSAVLKYRLDAAYEYLIENPETICIVTGGKGTNEVKPEAEGMAEYLEQRGIAGSRIRVENQSTTTTENLRFSMQFIDDPAAAVGIVTSNFHLYRAIRIAEKTGLSQVSGVSAGSVPIFLPSNMTREFFAIIKDFTQGNL